MERGHVVVYVHAHRMFGNGREGQDVGDLGFARVLADGSLHSGHIIAVGMWRLHGDEQSRSITRSRRTLGRCIFNSIMFSSLLVAVSLLSAALLAAARLPAAPLAAASIFKFPGS